MFRTGPTNLGVFCVSHIYFMVEGNRSMSFRDSGGKNGMMYYNWDIRRQRVDHDAGAQECVKFLETPDPCTLLFGPKRVSTSSPESARLLTFY